jgi:hypothetical protein
MINTLKFPDAPGVYALRHAPTGMTYIGSTNNLRKQIMVWRGVLRRRHEEKGHTYTDTFRIATWPNTHPEHWETFVLEYLLDGMPKDARVAREAEWITRVFGDAFDKVLNQNHGTATAAKKRRKPPLPPTEELVGRLRGK